MASNMHGGDAELTPCIGAHELAAYIDNRLSQAERNRTEAHLSRCNHCYRLLIDTLVTLNELGGGRDRGSSQDC